MAKYKDIAEAIRTKIMEGDYVPGEKLPYEYALCQDYHCNKETMKKALDILVKEGLIIRRRGAGTFVMDVDPHERQASIFVRSLTERFDDVKVFSDVIEFQVIPCDDFLAKKLQIEEFDFVYHIIRNRYVDERPYSVSITYIPLNIIPNLRAETLNGSLYEYVQNELKLSIQSAHITIKAAEATALDSDFLGVEEGDVCMQEEQITYLQTGAILEYTMIHYTCENYKFSTVMMQQ